MAKEFKILIERYNYTARTSLGRMWFIWGLNYVTDPPYPNKVYFGNTLEDTLRPPNIKVMKETGLPGGLKCKVSLYESPHYGKTIIFHTEDDKRTIKIGKLKWEACLTHGGNNHEDTEGCILVAKNIIDMNHIQESLKDKLREEIEKRIKEGYEITAEFVNLDQLN